MKQAKWALVTGASSGIGAALAKEYAQHGIHVVLTARREDRLRTLASELEQTYSIQTHVIVQDLAEHNAAQKIFDNTQANNLHIDILVNNAGYGFGEHFLQADWSHIETYLAVMVTSITQLTHCFLPPMLERRYGRVLFISSAVALMPGTASMNLYNSAKTYMIKFSESLWDNCKGRGVHVTVACPGLTHTEFQKVAGYDKRMLETTPSILWMSAEQVAQITRRASERNKVLVVPGWMNKLAHLLAHITPNGLIRGITSRALSRRVD